MIAIHQQCFSNLRLSVAGAIFLGAPFQGCNGALYGDWLARLAGRDATLLKLLERDNQDLYGLSRDFWGSYNSWNLVCFYEKKEVEYGHLKTQVRSCFALYRFSAC